MGFTEDLAKISVFVANFSFVLIGLALLIAGIVFHNDVHCQAFIEAIPTNYPETFGYVTIFSVIIGAVIFFIAFLGCCGALKDNTCMLTSYGAIFFVIFIFQICLGIYALVSIKDIDKDLQAKVYTGITDLFNQYNHKGSENSQIIVDLMQKLLRCCGTTGRTYWEVNNIPHPISCPDDITAPGCQLAFYDFIVTSTKAIGIGALAVSIVEVIGAVFAMCLSNCIRDRERRGTR